MSDWQGLTPEGWQVVRATDGEQIAVGLSKEEALVRAARRHFDYMENSFDLWMGNTYMLTVTYDYNNHPDNRN